MLEKFIHPGDAALLHETFTKAMESGSVYEFEHRLVRPDGTVRVVYDRAYPYFDENGNLLRYVGATVDITERAEAEEALRRSESSLRGILNATQESIWVFDGASETIVAGNAVAARRFGRPLEELLGKRFDEIMPPELAEGRSRRLRQVVETGQSVEFEDERAGYTFFHTFYPIFDEAGRVDRVVSFSRDITERKRVEQELQGSRERLELLAGIVESASQPVGVGLADGTLGFFNRAYSDLLGYSEEEFRTLDWTADLTPPDWRDFETVKLAELQETGRPVVYEKEYFHKDGSRVPVELLVHLVRDADEAPLYYFAFITDLRRHRLAEAEREQLLAEEQALNEELAAANEELRAQTEELVEGENALRESEERFGLALKNTPVSLAAMDRDLRYTWAYNQQTATPGEVIGKTDKELFPEQYKQLTRVKRNVIRTGKEAHQGLWITRPGRRMFLDLHMEPMRDASGSVAGLWITSVDLTAQMQAGASTRELAEQRQLALDGAKLGWWRYDPVSGISTWDKRYKEIFGVTEDARPNDEILTRLHPDDLTRVWASVEAALDPVDPQPYSAEYRIFLPDGSMTLDRGARRRHVRG